MSQGAGARTNDRGYTGAWMHTNQAGQFEGISSEYRKHWILNIDLSGIGINNHEVHGKGNCQANITGRYPNQTWLPHLERLAKSCADVDSSFHPTKKSFGFPILFFHNIRFLFSILILLSIWISSSPSQGHPPILCVVSGMLWIG